jgi:N-methylhydantoinase A/oxoprolinase/acetone carboxylase beta subunit
VGFRDILEIGRQIRSRLYDVRLQKPAPLVPRRWSLEVTERLDAEGGVLEPLDLEGVRRAVRQLRAENVEAVVICFLHAYLKFRSTVVLDRGKLIRGNVIEGPAIVEEHDAGTLVHPGWTATVDAHANLVLRP